MSRTADPGPTAPDAPDEPDEPDDEPAEHLRFAAHLRSLGATRPDDEAGTVREVLADPDPVMARSAVLRHLDRRAAGLLPDPGFDEWSASMAGAVDGDPLLTRRLREWDLLRSVTLARAWSTEDLDGASDWLQRKVSAESRSPRALAFLAVHGRTRRIRNAAAAGLREAPTRQDAGPPAGDAG
ncbi:hypothetical protein ACIQUQ_20170 [Streptomyces sp. NPDC101118]|uniref:hypothetical protein n=1 Tax=Streptomyces sp. NPDC101118 TaxID=3366109 RepID=UPI00382551E1